LDNNEDLYASQGTIHPIPADLVSHQQDTKHDGSLSTLLKTCNLVDIMGKQHLERPFPPTYSRGKKRLDYILISNSLVSTVINSGLLPYNAIFLSDHRSCYIDINPELLFNQQTYSLAPPCRRRLQLTDPRKVHRYNETMHKQAS
jgi:hypothetical protein